MEISDEKLDHLRSLRIKANSSIDKKKRNSYIYIEVSTNSTTNLRGML